MPLYNINVSYNLGEKFRGFSPSPIAPDMCRL